MELRVSIWILKVLVSAVHVFDAPHIYMFQHKMAQYISALVSAVILVAASFFFLLLQHIVFVCVARMCFAATLAASITVEQADESIDQSKCIQSNSAMCHASESTMSH